MNKFEIWDVIQMGLTTNFVKGEALAFLAMRSLSRNEEKCFSAKFTTGYGQFTSELTKILGDDPFIKTVEMSGRAIPHIVAIGDKEGKHWILALKEGCVYTEEQPEEFLEKYAGQY